MTQQIRQHKRSRYLIKKKFQLDFMLKFSLILLFGIALSTLLLLFLSKGTLTSTYAASGLQIQATGSAIMPIVVLTNLITAGVICLFAIVVMLFISHKIAGPLFRFEKDIERVSKGDLTVHINLREKDQFKDMARALNQMIDSLSSKVAFVDSRLSKIEDLQAQGKQPADEIRQLRTLVRDSFILSK